MNIQRSRICQAFFVAVLMAAATISAQRPGAFGVSDLLALKRVSDPQLSSDGSRVAYVVTEVNEKEDTRNSDIWVVPVTGGAPSRIITSDKNDDTPRWSPDGKRLAFVSTRDGTSQVYVVTVDGTDPSVRRRRGAAAQPRKLTSLATEASKPRWSPDGKSIAFVSAVFPECDSIGCNERTLKERASSKTKARLLEGLLFRHWVSWKDNRFSHLLVVPADGSSAPRDLTPGAADVPPFSLSGPDDYAFSPDSKEIAFVRKTDPVEAISTNSDVFVLDLTDPAAKPRQITTNKGADGGPVYSPDGRYIAYRAQEQAGFESDRWQLMLFDRRSNAHRSITASFDRSPDQYVWAPDSRTLFLVADDYGQAPIFKLDIGGRPTPIVSSGANAALNLSADGRMIVFSRSALHAPPEIYKAAADGSGETAITETNAELLARFGLKRAESVTFKGAGATPVQAWIVKPADFQADRKYPLLYLVHGGPQSVWGNAWSYRWNAQVFANAGYVVFMPNPRGSTGFGQQFTNEISGDWGGKVFEDLMKGADYAESLPYVDQSRTGAAGASYGGYMMNWFLGHTDRFDALVSHAGVYNLTSKYGVTEELWFPEWEFSGTPWSNPEQYEKWSPHLHAKKFKTPTLVTHGELDFRVPIGEGFQLFTTLQRLGVPSKMLYFPDEGHWILKPANSTMWYRTVIGWLDRWVMKKERRT